jgi:beta-ribofuranosylaminobenzene 5'-phosphate synthase
MFPDALTAGPSSSPVVQVTTGARLHFGPLAVGELAGRRFGGIGLMVDEPQLTVAAQQINRPRADHISAEGEVADRLRDLLGRLRDTGAISRSVSVAIAVRGEFSLHSGFGTGTQLALAVAQAIAGGVPISAETLAEWTGRGARSAIGVHGFLTGGFLVDAGKLPHESLGRIVARVDFPREWPILLWTPNTGPLISGDAERSAFHQMAPTPREVTDRLCGIVLRDLLPALADHDWETFSRSLADYGELVGRQFAHIQGGVFSTESARRAADWLQSQGVSGVAQTSWGPTIAAVLPSTDEAERLMSAWPDRDGRLRLTSARNRGAEIRVSSIPTTDRWADPPY